MIDVKSILFPLYVVCQLPTKQIRWYNSTDITITMLETIKIVFCALERNTDILCYFKVVNS